MEDKDLLEALRKEVAKLLPQVEGVMALRRIGDSIIPHLYRQGNNLSDLAMSPHAPQSVSILHGKVPTASGWKRIVTARHSPWESVSGPVTQMIS